MDHLLFRDFGEAARAVIDYLHRTIGFDLWMVTRTNGDQWVVLQSEDDNGKVEPGHVFRWTDSFCSRMVQGLGPTIAPDAQAIPAYAAAPVNEQLEIGAYIGLPLMRADGSLFGTLCAVDREPHPETLRAHKPTLDLLASLLSTLIHAETKAAEEARVRERLRAESNTDGLTKVFNRRGWEAIILAEECRCQMFGHPAAVVMIDLDNLKTVNDIEGHASGDAVLVRAAQILSSAVRGTDAVARLGGDEFGVLSVECDPRGMPALVERIRVALERGGIEASVGIAMRDPAHGLVPAVEAADAAMLEVKRLRKQGFRHARAAVSLPASLLPETFIA